LKLAILYTGRNNRFRELPEIVGVCHQFKSEVNNDCRGLSPRHTDTLGVKTIPFGRYNLSTKPQTCHDNGLIAAVGTIQQIQDSYRVQCCPTCK